MRLAAFFAAGMLIAAALQETDEPPPKQALVYAGKPLALPFTCTEEDMQFAGMSCTAEEPCPVYLELAAVEAAGSSLFLAGNLHSPATTLYSVLLASSDAGRSWIESYERIRGGGLDQIQFFDLESGWVAGQILHPLPHDPFLLVTQDGGKTWRRHQVFSESRFGSIVQFWFTSKKDGSVVIDRGQSSDSSRYERYESPNAGETWMIREAADQPIRLRRPPADPAWRIRADGPSQSFRVERRQGSGWAALAAFLVNAGECKPPERTFAEPPPESEEAPSAAAPPPPPPAPKRKPPTLKRK